MKKFILSSFAAIALVCSPMATASAAGGASLVLSPASGPREVNTTFSVAVKEQSSVPVAGIQADLTYDASKLQCLGIDGAGSAFTQTYPSSCGGGSVSIARTTQGARLTGMQHVATVNFKVLAGSGSTEIKAAGSSEILDENVNDACDSTCDAGTVLASYSLTTPAPSNGGSNNGGGNTGNTSSSNTSSPSSNRNSTVASANTSNNSAQNGSVEGENTQAAENNDAAQSGTAKDEGKKSDDKKTDDEKAKDESSNGWLWILVILAAIAAYTTYRRRVKHANPDATAKKKAADAEKAIVAAVETAKAKADAKAKDAKSAGAGKSKKNKSGKKNRRS